MQSFLKRCHQTQNCISNLDITFQKPVIKSQFNLNLIELQFFSKFKCYLFHSGILSTYAELH